VEPDADGVYGIEVEYRDPASVPLEVSGRPLREEDVPPA
jgi:hypothetical protein